MTAIEQVLPGDNLSFPIYRSYVRSSIQLRLRFVLSHRQQTMLVMPSASENKFKVNLASRVELAEPKGEIDQQLLWIVNF